MAVKTTYTCDKCKKVQEEKGDLWHVGISVNCGKPASYTNAPLRMEVCRPCLESFGIYMKDKDTGSIVTDPIPTLEALIEEIVQRCIDNQ